jgi:hypothetical protein
MPIRFNGITQEKAETNFIKQVKRDEEVKKYCEDNNIKLIVIKYDMKQSEIEKIIKDL